MIRPSNIQTAMLLAPIALASLAPGPAFAQAQPPFTMQYEGRLTVHEDRTATEISTKRIKILAPSVIQTLSQQQLQFIEGMQRLETVEAYTEKADGKRVAVDPANIITRDGAAGLQATFAPDLKVRTIVFPDVGVGDTLVMTNKVEIVQDEFPGQFTDSDVFPRSQSLSSVKLTIEGPVSLDLAVRATGDGATDKVEVVDGVRRHTISIVPQSYRPDEPGAISPYDSEPAILVSTFHSFEELGQAYGKAALPKIEATPAITALADEITKDAVGHKAQAAAIDAWMKKNIRYVAIFLSVGRVVPHDAEAILRNRFGDCKDKATLMAALLAAKGIASEAALINLGNAYELPEPATLAVLNHVILYLPEFDLYDDPTASGAAFGVLAAEAYYKPVVRVSASGAKLGLTPVMKPEEHTAHARTTVKFAADGAVTGETQESNTGVFAMGLRFAAGVVQQAGGETIAQRQLQSFNTPGTGHIELGNTSETVDPAELKSTFTLNGRFKAPPPGGLAIVPVGMPLTLRPGNFLLGARLAGRASPFICYAGTQIEDIEATFDPALPLPNPLPAVVINNPQFTYLSASSIKDRTLKVHRVLISRVERQVCPAEVETQIAADMDKVRTDTNSAYRFVTQLKPQEATVAIAPGQKRRLDFVYSINVDCSSRGWPNVTVVEPPQHGKVAVDPGTGKSTFPPANPRVACNAGEVGGAVITYEPAEGFVGADAVTVNIAYPTGDIVKRRFAITVTPNGEAPGAHEAPIAELSRVAVADQSLRVAFLAEVNPDCTSAGRPTVRVFEQPKSGKVTIESGPGFTAFAATNLRFKCNSNRSDGVIVAYAPKPGYTGADSFAMEIIYLDGTSSRRRYAIDVK